jgi:hypothetical protein
VTARASPSGSIACRTHGDAYATSVCRHLARDPKQRWFGGYPTNKDPWPAAWCESCNRRRSRQGRRAKADRSEVVTLCHCCYEDARSTGSTYLSADARKGWRQCVKESHAALHRKQERLRKDFDLSEHERWDWDQGTGQIVFSNDGVPAVIARVHFIGSVATPSGTWLWAWANHSFDRKVRDASKKIRDFGEKRRFGASCTWRS